MKNLKVVVGIPSTQFWDADFAMCLIFMMAHFVQKVPGTKTQQVVLHNKRGSILSSMRQKILENAIKNEATHLLFIDTDQTFPKDALHRLLAREKQVVACNIATKMLPSTTTARLRGGNPGYGVPLYTLKDSTGLVEVWRVGTGVMLIDLNVFKRQKMEPPWFTQRFSEHTGEYIGEDWALCERFENAGVKIYVDQDLSKEIGHRGMLEYGHDVVEVKDNVGSCEQEEPLLVAGNVG